MSCKPVPTLPTKIKAVFIVWILFPLLATAQQAYFVRNGWLGEGTPVILSLEKPIVLRAQPDKDSEIVAEITAPKDEKLEWKQSVVRTIKPGVIRLKKSFEFEASEGRPIIPKEQTACPNGKITVQKNETIKTLCYGAEGWAYVELKGCIYCVFPAYWYGGGGTAADDQEYESIENEITEWWVKIHRNEKSGWLLLDDNAPIAFGDRILG